MNYIRAYSQFLHSIESPASITNAFDVILKGIDDGDIPYPEEKIDIFISMYEKKYGKLMMYQKAIIACSCIVHYNKKK